jgi:hypothetical protein
MEPVPAQLLAEVGELVQAAQLCDARLVVPKRKENHCLMEPVPAQLVTEVGELVQAAQLCDARLVVPKRNL